MSDRFDVSPRDAFQALWLAMPVPAAMTADQVRRRATHVATWKRRRAIAIAAVIALGVGQTVTAVIVARSLSPWEWAGIAYLVLFAAGLLWVTLTDRPGASSMGGTECVRVYRTLLEHERDANRGRTLAVRVLLVFGLLVHSAIIAVKYVPAAFWPITAIALAASCVIWQRGQARARLFQTHMDAIDRTTQ